MTVKRNIFKRTIRILIRIFAIILGILLMIVFLLNTSPVQTLITGKICAYLEDKIGTPVDVGSVKITFPKAIKISGVYLQDQQDDTLLYLGELKVDIDLLKLIRKRIEVNSLTISNLHANVHRKAPQNLFNFQYIPDAFSSTGSPETTELCTGDPWTFSVSGVFLENVQGSYYDDLIGTDAGFNLGKLSIALSALNLDDLMFDVDNIELNNTRGFVEMWQVLSSENGESGTADDQTPSESASLPGLKLKKLLLDNVSLAYRNRDLEQDFTIDIGALEFRPEKIDLNNRHLDLGTFSLEDTQAKVILAILNEGDSLAEQPPVIGDNTDSINLANSPFPDWEITMNHLRLQNINASFDNNAIADVETGIDFSHLHLTGLKLDLKDFVLFPDSMRVTLNNLAFHEKSGLNLNKLTSIVRLSGESAHLSAFELESGKTSINTDISLDFQSFEQLSSNPGDIGLSFSIENTRLALGEIPLFAPALAENELLRKYLLLSPVINLDASGKLNNLTIDNLMVDVTDQTRIKLSGNIFGLPEPDNLSFQINLDTLYSTRNDIQTLLDTAWFSGLELPEYTGIAAMVSGKTDSLRANFLLSSEFGAIRADTLFYEKKEAGRDTFNLILAIKNWELGTMLHDQQIGTLDLNAQLSGSGAASDSIFAKMDVNINEAWYNGYGYHDLKIGGGIEKMLIHSNISSTDPNLRFQLDASADLNNKEMRFSCDLNLELVNLFELKLLEEKIALSTSFKGIINYTDLENADANINFSTTRFIDESGEIPIDKVSIETLLSADSATLKIESDLLMAYANTNAHVAELEGIAKSALKKYLNLRDTVELPKGKYLGLTIDFNAADNFRDFLLPDIEMLVINDFVVKYFSDDNRLDVDFKIPAIRYDAFHLDSLFLSARGRDNNLDFELGLNEIAYDTLFIKNFIVNESIRAGKISSQISLGEQITNRDYLFSNEILWLDTSLIISFVRDGLVLNGNPWEIEDGNFLEFTESGIYTNAFNFNHKDEKVSIVTSDEKINIGFEKFGIENILGIVRSTHMYGLFGGVLNGSIAFDRNMGGEQIDADLTIRDLHVLDTLAGNLFLKFEASEEKVQVAVKLENSENTITLDGRYHNLQADTAYDFNAKIDIENFGRFERFTFNQLSQMSGKLDGEFQILGTGSDPKINGFLTFNSVSMKINSLNFLARLNHESVRLDDKGVHFDKFTITDATDKQLELNGDILTTNFTDFGFDLNIHADHFQPVNSTKADNSLFYGSLFLGTDLKIRGDMKLPVIEADLTIDKGTNLTYVLPGSEIELVSSEGIVNFNDPNLLADTLFARVKGDYLTDSIMPKISGINLTANLKLSPEAQFTVIIDPYSGDYLTIGGIADLNITLDQSGGQTITGVFEVRNGYYQLSFYGLVKKSFTLQPGSSVAWSGRPMDANINLTAKHVVRTSSLALVANETTSMSDAEKQVFMQRLPYEVLLKISGFIAEPKVGFGIMLPDKDLINYPQIASKLTFLNSPDRESELNKQVFALLVTGSFIAENPLASTGSSPDNIATTAARNSVNGILAAQLNKISNKFVKGVDMNFGLTTYDDYGGGSSQTRTELDVQVSKKLMHDRLTIEASGSFDLEGDNKKYSGQTSQNMYGEFAVTYDLTENGEYKLRLYRENAYDLFDGEVTYSGIAFILEKSFNSLIRHKEKKQKEKEKKQNNDGLKSEGLVPGNETEKGNNNQ
nr:translocation/assembly module TamB domain-containing protein [Bacteroidota bacterium]